MDLESIENRRRYPLALQLAPMIDIFVLIIVFLLKSTIVADVSIVFPSGMHPPLSKSKEALETFPEVVVTESEVRIGILDVNINLADIDRLPDDRMADLKNKVEQYVKSKDEKIRSQATHVNLITYRGNNYKSIFSAVKFLRRIGFQSVAFIAEGEG